MTREAAAGLSPRTRLAVALGVWAWWGVIFVMAFGWRMAIAAAYEALCDQQARGVMDRAW
jgi:hypothetical protein